MKLTTRLIVSYVARGIILIETACFAVLASAAPIGEAEVRQCVQDILQRAGAGACSNYFFLESVKKVDARQTSTEAFVIADIDFRVKQRAGGTSQVATQCTGAGWRGETKNPYPSNTGQWFMYQSQADLDGGYLEPGRGLRVRKKFKFELWESGWRCAEGQMRPIDQMWFVNTPAPPTAPMDSARPDNRVPGISSARQGQMSRSEERHDDSLWLYDEKNKIRLEPMIVDVSLLANSVASLFGTSTYADLTPEESGPAASLRVTNKTPSFGEFEVPVELASRVSELVQLVKVQYNPDTKRRRAKLAEGKNQFSQDASVQLSFTSIGESTLKGKPARLYRAAPSTPLDAGEYSLVVSLKYSFPFGVDP